MRSMANEFKVGLLAICAFAILLGVNWMIRGVSVASGGYTIYVTFSSLAGIREGGDVSIAGGLKVGKVEQISLEGKLARVKLWLKNKVRLTTESRITIATASILGEPSITIATDPGNGQVLKEGDTIRGEDPVGMMDGLKEFGSLMKNFNSMLGGDATKKLINDITESVRKTSRSLDRLLVESSQDIRTIFRNLNRVTGKLDSLLDEFKGMGDQIRRLVTSLEASGKAAGRDIPATLADLRRAGASLQALLTQAKSGQNLVAALLSDRKLYLDVKFIIENIKKLSFKLQQDPSIILWRDTKQP